MPQLVDTSQGTVTLQLLTLDCLFVLKAIVTDGLYAPAASTAGQWFKRSCKN